MSTIAIDWTGGLEWWTGLDWTEMRSKCTELYYCNSFSVESGCLVI